MSRLFQLTSLLAFIAACSASGPPPEKPARAAASSGSADVRADASSAAPEPSQPRELTQAEIEALLAEWGEIMPNLQGMTYAAFNELEDEEKWFFTTCKSFAEAMTLAARKAREEAAGSPPDMLAVIPKLVAEFRSTELDSAQVKQCADFMILGVRTYLYSSRMVDAKVVLESIARGFRSKYEAAGELCPGTTKPAPQKWDASRSRYLVAEGDFDAPAFKCVFFAPYNTELRFQLEIDVDTSKQSFVASALMSVREDHTQQRLTIRGKVEDGVLTYGEVEGPDAKALAKEAMSAE